MEKKEKLPKIVSVTEKLIDQVKYFVSSMPLVSAQKDVKNFKTWKSNEEGRLNVELVDLDILVGYLRVLPLYMSGELYTRISMDVKPYDPSAKLTVNKSGVNETDQEHIPEDDSPVAEVKKAPIKRKLKPKK